MNNDAKAFAQALNPSPEKEKQREVINAICLNMRDYVLSKVVHMPDDWDGHEIREYLARLFERERTTAMTDKRDRWRRRRFLREVNSNENL